MTQADYTSEENKIRTHTIKLIHVHNQTMPKKKKTT